MLGAEEAAVAGGGIHQTGALLPVVGEGGRLAVSTVVGDAVGCLVAVGMIVVTVEGEAEGWLVTPPWVGVVPNDVT